MTLKKQGDRSETICDELEISRDCMRVCVSCARISKMVSVAKRECPMGGVVGDEVRSYPKSVERLWLLLCVVRWR